MPGSAPGCGGRTLRARAAAGRTRHRLAHAPRAAASRLAPAPFHPFHLFSATGSPRLCPCPRGARGWPGRVPVPAAQPEAARAAPNTCALKAAGEKRAGDGDSPATWDTASCPGTPLAPWRAARPWQAPRPGGTARDERQIPPPRAARPPRSPQLSGGKAPGSSVTPCPLRTDGLTAAAGSA